METSSCRTITEMTVALFEMWVRLMRWVSSGDNEEGSAGLVYIECPYMPPQLFEDSQETPAAQGGDDTGCADRLSMTFGAEQKFHGDCGG